MEYSSSQNLEHAIYHASMVFMPAHESTPYLVSEPNPLRPLQDLQYGLGETVFGGCRHLEYINIWGFNEPK